jgi:hypothetical protein
MIAFGALRLFGVEPNIVSFLIAGVIAIGAWALIPRFLGNSD